MFYINFHNILRTTQINVNQISSIRSEKTMPTIHLDLYAQILTESYLFIDKWGQTFYLWVRPHVQIEKIQQLCQ